MSEAEALKNLSKHFKSCQNLPEIVQIGSNLFKFV